MNEQENYQTIQEEGAAPIKAWVNGVLLEEGAKQQLKNIARLPFIYSHVAVMPDVHWGMGATVGSVIATKGAIIPAAVGVDLGCGMAAHRLRISASDLPDSLGHLRAAIEKAVPHGRTGHVKERDKGSWGTVKIFDHPSEAIRNEAKRLDAWLKKIVQKHPRLTSSAKYAWNHSGTLGTGNHFIELCIDEEQRVWVMLHSGSRGIGGAIGSYFIERAKLEMQKYFISLPDVDLSYIPTNTQEYNDYLNAVEWAQQFAALNRTVMMHATLDALHKTLGVPIDSDMEAINCFPGDTEVSALDVKEAHKRYYDGEVVTLTTKSGRRLTVTPNHPILATTGWVRATDIQVGDNLIGTSRPCELSAGVNPDVDNVPTQFAQLFDAVSVNGTARRVVGSAVNFHGDVALSAEDREVDVVGSDRMLPYGRDAALLKKLREFGLLSPDLTESGSLGERLVGEFGITDWSVATSLVSSGGQSAALAGTHSLHAVSEGSSVTTSLNSCASEKLGDAGSTDVGISGKSLDGSSFGIALDEVVDVVRGHWAGHVYNLSTESGWYFANGIVAHNCHHNYISEERHFGENVLVTRKGAVHAGKDVLGIIPGSMGAKSYIVKGKGNRESFCSCSHGAGRAYSRNKARSLFSLEDHAKATEGIECRKDADVIDETPLAYKPIDAVMAVQQDLVEIVHTLKQVLCVKG